MENFLSLIGAFIIGLLLVVIAMPRVIPFLHKMKYGQVQREEGPQSHMKKSGTPTMGGIVFIIATVLAATIINFQNLLNPTYLILTFVIIAYGAIGLLDDALIIIKKNNEGLKPLYKYGLQSVAAIGFYLLAINFIPGFDTLITIPLVNATIDMGWLYPVLVYFMFTATTNGVNLSDGLDGLATGLTMISIAPFVIFSMILRDYVTTSYALALIGALLGFMVFNYHPAKIFMGDVGSLALGGILAAFAILTGQEILLVLIGGVYVMETLSVIIQVISFKTRGKRVFKMAPIHHHFEMMGWNEQQVVISFWFMAFICALAGIVIGVL